MNWFRRKPKVPTLLDASDESSHNESFIYAFLIIVGFGCFVVGLVWQEFPLADFDNNNFDKIAKIVAGFINGLGITLLTSAVLAFSFERLSRIKMAKRAEKERENIKNDVFQSIFGNFFPQKIMSEFNQSLKLAEVIKEKVTHTITLRDLPQHDGHFVAEIEQEFTVRNTCARLITHEVVFYLEVPLNKNHEALSQFKLVRIGRTVFQGTILKNKVSKTDKGDYVVFREPIKLKPLEDVKVIFSYITIKRNFDYELFVNLRPQSDITVCVKAPEGTVVMADANNSVELIETSLSPNSKRWWLDHGMMPYQSITVWWKENPENEPGLAGATGQSAEQAPAAEQPNQ